MDGPKLLFIINEFLDGDAQNEISIIKSQTPRWLY